MKKPTLNKRWLGFGGLGLVAYLVFLVSGFPATVAYENFVKPADRGRVVNLQGVSGTLWSGSAAETKIANLSLGKLDWDMQIWRLLTGKLGLDVNLSSSDGQLEGELLGEMDGLLNLSDVQGDMSAQSLAPLFYGLPIAMSGDLKLAINHAELKQGSKLVVDGKVTWKNAALTAPQPMEFGDLFLVARPEPNGSKILLSDQGGPLTLEGTIQVKNSGEYKINLLLGTRGENKGLQNALKFLGRTNPSGKVQVSRTGRLRNWR